jgi:hypothetical protein
MGVLQNLEQAIAYRNPALFEWIEAVSKTVDDSSEAPASSYGLVATGAPVLIGTTDLQPLQIYVNGMSALGVAPAASGFGGDVGIGTLMPAGRLEVMGAVLFDGIGYGDFPSGGSIGSAATTVDLSTTIQIAQTTPGQVLTIEPPTNPQTGRILFLNNNGTASFTILGRPIGSAETLAAIWNGAVWSPVGPVPVVGGGASAPLVLGDIATGPIGTAAATVDAYRTIIINETTGGQTLVLPDPTAGVNGQELIVVNDGSAQFNLNGSTGYAGWAPMKAGHGRLFVWSTASSRWRNCEYS